MHGGQRELTSSGSSRAEIEGKKMSEHSERSMERLIEVENDGSSSCVVEMEHMLNDTSPSVEQERWKKTFIYRVPEWHKNMSNRKAYLPWLVSLGPFHHGEADLLPMEEHKRRAVRHLVERAGRPLTEFLTAIEEVADKLLDAYQGLDDKWRGECRAHFVDMMVTDGCFLLEIMRTRTLRQIGIEGGAGADNDYAAKDPVFSNHGLHYLFVAIQADLVAMENQLPLLVLERLVAVQRGTPPSSQKINTMVALFLSGPRCPRLEDLGLHPLDIFHKCLRGGRRYHEQINRGDAIIPTAMELREAWVHLKRSKTPLVHDIDFDNGVLSLPVVKVHDGTEKLFLNLVAFEQLHPDAGRYVTDYLLLMGHIIDSEKDVALLRSKGIITNLISDKAVADLFNKLTSGATSNSPATLLELKRKVNVHCAKRRNKWRAFFVKAYLSNPWVFTSLVAAVILLVATLLQTMYTVVPFYTKN